MEFVDEFRVVIITVVIILLYERDHAKFSERITIFPVSIFKDELIQIRKFVFEKRIYLSKSAENNC